MKIREIHALGLRGATPKGGWSAELQPDDCVHTLVEVRTDEGLSGIGGVFTSLALVEGALGVLRPLCLGETALEPERLTETLHQQTFWQGRGGAVTHAISGIDIALWDILGQATGQPVGRLLGGRYRERVTPYASVLMAEPAPLADTLRQIRAQGFRAFKVGWGPFGRVSPALDEAIVRAVRLCRRCEQYDLSWLEEPLPADDLAGYARLAATVDVRIAAGEQESGVRAFRTLIEQGHIDVIQPDVSRAGGLTECRRIGELAEAANVPLVPHAFKTGILQAASLHLAATLPHGELCELTVRGGALAQPDQRGFPGAAGARWHGGRPYPARSGRDTADCTVARYRQAY